MRTWPAMIARCACSRLDKVRARREPDRAGSFFIACHGGTTSVSSRTRQSASPISIFSIALDKAATVALQLLFRGAERRSKAIVFPYISRLTIRNRALEGKLAAVSASAISIPATNPHCRTSVTPGNRAIAAVGSPSCRIFGCKIGRTFSSRKIARPPGPPHNQVHCRVAVPVGERPASATNRRIARRFLRS